VIPIALAEHEDLTRFYASKIGDETGSLVAEHHQGKSMAYSFDVLVMKGDDLLPRFELDAISVIKIDVEEAEIYVLRGLVETLKKYRPYVYSEILDVGNDANRIQRKNEMCELFKDLDYRIFGIDKTSMALSLISDYDKVGIDYQQEYIFCPAENVPAFLENIKNNTSNIKVN
jgi:hypothetical protein